LREKQASTRESVSCKWNAWDLRKMHESWDLCDTLASPTISESIPQNLLRYTGYIQLHLQLQDAVRRREYWV